jgi:para-nitrobenzyl esterase
MEICKKKYGVTDVAGLRKLKPEEILEAQAEVTANFVLCPLIWMPVIDGTVIPKDPFAAIQDGAAADIALLNGTNRDEYCFWISFKPSLQSEPLGEFLAEIPWFGKNLGERKKEVLDFYNKKNPTPGPDKSSIPSSVAYVTDAAFFVPNLKVSEAQAKHAKVWMYRMDWKENVKDQEFLNACHAIELPFVFKSFDPDQGAPDPNPQTGLSDAMQDAWISFVRTGNPNHKGLPEWPAYEPTRRATMIFDTKSKVLEDPDPEARKLFKDIPF